MNSSEGDIVVKSFQNGVKRAINKTEEGIKQVDEEKKRHEEIKEVLELLAKAYEEVQEILKNMITRDEMNERFNTFLNDFGHAIESIEDPKVKGIRKRTFEAFREG